ncbi:MAG TPA: ferrochelatase [Ignavibacteria bacterium]|jgi:ferrochelatase
MSSNSKIAVVLLNLGGPDSLEAVEPFLYNLFSDPDIINFPLSFLFRKRLAKFISSKRAPKIQEQYKRIGGKSPILDITKKQAEMLEKRLNKSIDAKVFIAMRYWKPFTSDAIDLIEKENFDKIILLPLYPQYSIATTGSSVNEWKRQIQLRNGIAKIETQLVEKYYLDTLYTNSIVARINEALNKFPETKRKEVNILFSAHGTPVKLVKQGDPYSHHIRETVNAVIKAGNIKLPIHLCFQSKVGPQKWLTPSTPDTITRLANEGVKDILMVPVAFTSDHLETLFELNVEYRHLAKELGIENVEMTEGLNDSEIFISALEKLVLEKVNGNSNR